VPYRDQCLDLFIIDCIQSYCFGSIDLHNTAKNSGNDDAVSSVDVTDSWDNGADGLPTSGGFAILTRAESDSGATEYSELSNGEALIIRKADGRASEEAIESLVLSHKLLGTKKWIVIHYIGDDDAPLFDHAAATELLGQSRFEAIGDGETISNRPHPGQSSEEWEDAWIRFWQAASRNLGEVAAVIRADVDRIRTHPRTPADVAVEGYIRDLKLQTFSKL
jgi:carbonic anhydrase